MTPQHVTNFWEQAGESRWFFKDSAFDGALKVRFGQALAEARDGAFDTWGETHIPSLIVHHRGSRPVQLILVLLVVFRIFTQHSEINHQVESSRADRGHLPHYNILCHAF